MIKTMTIGAVMLATLCTLNLAAQAAEYSFTVTNNTGADVTGIKIAGGTLKGFRGILSKNAKTLTVTLPDGTCAARAVISFSDGDSLTYDAYDFCSETGFSLQ